MGEELLDALECTGDRVQATGGLAAAWQGDVNAFGSQASAELGFFKGGLAGIEHNGDALFGVVDQRADFRPLFGWQVAQGLHHLGQLALLAEIINPDLFQGIDVFSALHGL